MKFYRDRFKDKVCIVTGGARGIGAAIATRLGVEGCSVVIFDIDEKPAGIELKTLKARV